MKVTKVLVVLELVVEVVVVVVAVTVVVFLIGSRLKMLLASHNVVTKWYVT